MNIDEIFNSYSNKVVQIHLYQRAVKELARKELAALNDYALSLEGDSYLKEIAFSHNNIFFRNAITGAHQRIGYRSSSVKDRQLANLLHKNKQYQWLLAEAYEEFEDFIEHAYAYAASVDNDFWPLSDYGNISLSELNEKEFDWYLAQAQAKRDRPNSILNQIRKKIPCICSIEAKNNLDVNLRLALSLVENLRHVIVHVGGIVSDRDAFTKRVLEKAAVYNNGKPKEEYVSFIHSFFGANEYEKTILLLEIRVEDDFPLEKHISQFDVVSGYMTAYAHLIATKLKEEIAL